MDRYIINAFVTYVCNDSSVNDCSTLSAIVSNIIHFLVTVIGIIRLKMREVSYGN